MKMMPELWMHT